MQLRLRLKKIPPQASLKPGTARSVGQRLTYRVARASVWPRTYINIYTTFFPPVRGDNPRFLASSWIISR